MPRRKILKYILSTIFIIILVCLGYYFLFEKNKIPHAALQSEPKYYKYGFPVDDYVIDTGIVKRAESLSAILQKYDISLSMVDKIARKAKDVFNVRRIRTGRKYMLLSSQDSICTPEYFIYENTSVEYIVFDLTDTMKVYRGEKKIETKSFFFAAKIESSLWNAIVEQKGNPLLALELEYVYQWTIDFFGIQKGDYFKVFYTEDFVEGKSVGNIIPLAISFNHMDSTYFAFAFEDSVLTYYDELGGNLQKTFLKAPLRYYRISSGFSGKRFHPVLKRYRSHYGVDYAAPTGTHVYSVGDGKITKKSYQRRGGGRYIKIKHNSVYETVYMHLSRFAKGIAPGVKVKQGQLIGYVGSSGLSTGPHLDFRIYKNGSPINPLTFKAPPANPLPEKHKAVFAKLRDAYSMHFDNLSVDSTMEKAVFIPDSVLAFQ